jgi:branched-subunit amino acid transport protein AzlD
VSVKPGEAQHLAVGPNGLAALVPWGDVVSFHLLKREVILADGADAFLALVRFAFLIVSEGANAQVPLFR